METYFPKSLDEFIDLFFRRKKLFFIPFFCVLILVLASYPFLPRLYKASALILVEEERVTNPLEREDSSNARLRNRLKAINAQVLSFNNVLNLIRTSELSKEITSPDDVDRFVEKTQDRIDIEQEGKTLIEVSFHHKNPQTARSFTNALAENLVDKNAVIQNYLSQKRIEFIDNQLHIYKEKLENSETSFLSNKAQSELSALLKKRDLIRKQHIPVESKTRSELIEAESELNRLLIDAKPGHPLVKDLQEKVEKLRAQVQKELAMKTDENTASENPVFQEAMVNRMETLKDLDIQIAALRKRLQDLKTGTNAEGKVSPQELLAMERDKAVNEDIYRSLLIQLENAQINKRMSATGGDDALVILETARTPRLPSKPNPIKTAAAGVGLAFFCGLAFMFGREFFDSSFRGIKDAKSYLNFSFLGFTPKFQEASEEEDIAPAANGNGAAPQPKRALLYPTIKAHSDPFSKEAEQYRIIRTNLFNQSKRKPFKSILFTSSWEKEGKTTTLANLAASIGNETGKKVLLVDADLRRGSLAPLLNLEREKGLRDILEGSLNWKEAIKKPEGINVDVITSGTPIQNPTSLLDRENAAGRFLEEVNKEYDLVLVDGPPVLNIADVPILVNFVDGVLVVIKSLATRREQAQMVQLTLQQSAQDKLLGYVLTCLESHIPEYAKAYHPDAIY